MEPIFLVKPKSKFVASLQNKIVVKEDEEIIIGGAHLHEFGQKIDLTVNGKVVNTYIPEYKDNRIVKVNQINRPRMSLSKGDVLDTAVYYDNTSDEEIEGMSIVMLYSIRR